MKTLRRIARIYLVLAAMFSAGVGVSYYFVEKGNNGNFIAPATEHFGKYAYMVLSTGMIFGGIAAVLWAVDLLLEWLGDWQ